MDQQRFDPDDVRVIAFDVFGTVVDWHSGVAAEVSRVLPGLDGDAFALDWRSRYGPAMQRAMTRLAEGGSFTLLDVLHREMLEETMAAFDVAPLDEPAMRDLSLVWHRLPAWPDAVQGLTRLKRKYTICTLSNGNIGLLTEMAKRAGLPWDCILSAENFRAYKLDPRVYSGAVAVFDLPPHQVMLAATHHEDLAAARACGMSTAYVERPDEFGAARTKDISPRPENSVHATDIDSLADLLRC